MKFLGIFFIGLGFLSIVFNISHPLGLSGEDVQFYDSNINRFLFGAIQLLVGYLFFRYNPKEIEKKYSKYPNCKEVFKYEELKEGKCKNCKNVDTIDLEEY